MVGVMVSVDGGQSLTTPLVRLDQWRANGSRLAACLHLKAPETREQVLPGHSRVSLDTKV